MGDDSKIPNVLEGGSYAFACNPCKTRKVKCDKLAPACSSCIKSKRDCVFPAFVPRPGPKPDTPKPRRRRRHDDADTSTSQERSPSRRRTGGDSVGSDVEPQLDCSMSALVHPVHNSTHTDHALHSSQSNTHALANALSVLEMTQEDYWSLLNAYFSNMVAFCIFHKPTFHQKVASIQSSLQIQALIVALLVVASRYDFELHSGYLNSLTNDEKCTLATRLARQSMTECLDECPPLHILQSMLLIAWTHAYQGMRGRAWRVVGDCVRLCYEMELHEERDGSNSSPHWLYREECRRAWWTTWELDVFASTIKRLPTAIDWASNGVHLPMDDSSWLAETPAKSCSLALDPVRRWKDLDQCSSRSGWAWFILFNSYKWDTYILAVTPQAFTLRNNGSDAPSLPTDAIQRRREVLANSLHCARMAMPQHLDGQGKLLTFNSESRADDAWRYSIVLMTSVVRFMMCRMDLFPPRTSQNLPPNVSASQRRMAWDSLTETSNTVAALLRNSASDHVNLVNPCLSNAVWWQGCAMILRRVFDSKAADHTALTSVLDVMRMTISSFIRVANVPSSLLESLDNMEERLRGFGRRDPKTTSTYPSLETSSANAVRPHQVPQNNHLPVSTPELNVSLSSVSPMMSDTGPFSMDPPAFGDIEIGSTDFLQDLDVWDFDSHFFRCPFE